MGAEPSIKAFTRPFNEHKEKYQSALAAEGSPFQKDTRMHVRDWM